MDAINISELVLTGSEAAKSQASKKKNNPPVYEVVVNSGADVAIRRTQGRSRRLLVMLVSQGQYYVKNEGTGEVRELDEKTLSQFMSGSGGSITVNNQWLDELLAEKGERDFLLRVMSTDSFGEAAKSGIWSMGDARPQFSWERNSCNYASLMKLIASHGALAKSVKESIDDADDVTLKRRIKKSFPAFCAVENAYGLDRARLFIKRYIDSGVEVALDGDVMGAVLNTSTESDTIGVYRHSTRYSTNINGFGRDYRGTPIVFSFDKFCDYLLIQSCREGFARELREWLITWRDALVLQFRCFDKVTDKYPENLLSAHMRLSTTAESLKQKIDERLWAGATSAMEALDWKPDAERYLISHPTCPDDMRREAAAQSNCLASYIDAAAKGRTLIAFLRRATDPESSFVTIEVSPDEKRIIQAKARFNKEVNDDALAFIGKWCAARSINPGCLRDRLIALGA